MISETDIHKIQNECPFKEEEIKLLSFFLQPELELCQPTLILEGSPSSGKTQTITKYLKTLESSYNISYEIIDCSCTFTQREVIRKMYKCILKYYELLYSVVDNEIFSDLTVSSIPYASRLIMDNIEDREVRPLVIVFDDIDSIGDLLSVGELIKCISKLHELIKIPINFVFVVTRFDFLNLGTLSLPCIRFNGYTFAQFKQVLYVKLYDEFWMDVENSKRGRNSGDGDENDDDDDEDGGDSEFDDIKKEREDLISISIEETDRRLFFKQFLNLIMDTYKSYIGLSFEVVIPILKKIWEIFKKSILEIGSIINGKNDAFTIFIKNKNLLNKEFAIIRKLENTEISIIEISKRINNCISDNINHGNYDLTIKTKYLLIASYLASYNETKYDMKYFSKGNKYNSIIKKHSNKRIKANEQGIGKLRRSMNASMPFKIERLLSILRSIWIENNDGNWDILNDVELMSEIATLSTLKALIKIRNGDTISGQSRWKCNLNWKIIKKFSDDVGFKIENYLQD